MCNISMREFRRMNDKYNNQNVNTSLNFSKATDLKASRIVVTLSTERRKVELSVVKRV